MTSKSSYEKAIQIFNRYSNINKDNKNQMIIALIGNKIDLKNLRVVGKGSIRKLDKEIHVDYFEISLINEKNL